MNETNNIQLIKLSTQVERRCLQIKMTSQSVINFSILYVQNNLFEEHEDGSEEEEIEDDAGLSSCNKNQKTC